MKAGDTFTRELFARLLEEEYDKLQKAGNRDVHDDSKHTTLPIAREIAQTYVMDDVKLPWYIDLLNINLNNSDLTEAKRRIRHAGRRVPQGRHADHGEPGFQRRCLPESRDSPVAPIRELRESGSATARGSSCNASRETEVLGRIERPWWRSSAVVWRVHCHSIDHRLLSLV